MYWSDVSDPARSAGVLELATRLLVAAPLLRSCSSLLCDVCLFSSAFPSGYLYAIGGFNGQTPLKTVERYSAVTGQWSRVADMNEQRYGVGVGVMNGECVCVCVCGGVTDWLCVGGGLHACTVLPGPCRPDLRHWRHGQC